MYYFSFLFVFTLYLCVYVRLYVCVLDVYNLGVRTGPLRALLTLQCVPTRAVSEIPLGLISHTQPAHTHTHLNIAG